METLESVVVRIGDAIPGAGAKVVPNGVPGAPASLVVERSAARAVAEFLRDDSRLRLDYCSNVTGVDWLARTEKAKVRKLVDGVEREVEEARTIPGYLEAVYHLYSVALRQGPVVLRVRTPAREGDVSIPSLTPVWRSCEFQEREVYDLFGIVFEGHPDLRRLLMWEGFRGHPMRKDYVEPDDYEYEPTPHDRVLERVQSRQRAAGAGEPGGIQ